MSYANYPTREMNPQDQRLWATLVHIGGIFLSFWPALIGFLILKDRGAFVREHTAQALNFQLTLLIAYLVGGALTFVLVGYLLLLVAAVLAVLFPILAAVAANRGERYTYPLTFQFVH